MLCSSYAYAAQLQLPNEQARYSLNIVSTETVTIDKLTTQHQRGRQLIPTHKDNQRAR